MKNLFLLLAALLPPFSANWGFHAHKEINRLAVFTLPAGMFSFYKSNIDFITEEAVTADKRRHTVKEEAPRHYIDLDIYDTLPPSNWKAAVDKYTEDTLIKYGILPWHLILLKHELTEAFKAKDFDRILKISADVGHYLADANVPLHTTVNYNGQLTGQHGIHGLWESRLPELFSRNYDFLTGKASYLDNPTRTIWETIISSHNAVDSVLKFEKVLSEKFPADKKYSFEERGKSLVKVYSQDYSQKYHKLLDKQVERQMRKSIKLVGDFWYTCWVDAGQPELNNEKVHKNSKINKEQTINSDCEELH